MRKKYQCVKRKQICNGSEERVSGQEREEPFVMTTMWSRYEVCKVKTH